MPRTPKASTARSNESSYEYSHGESHEVDGSDPVLPQMLYHGSAINSTTTGQSITSVFSTFTDITNLTMDVRTRGGDLLILMNGPIIRVTGESISAVEASLRMSLDGSASDWDDRNIYLLAQELSITGVDLGIGVNPGFQWVFNDVKPGTHTISASACVHNVSGASIFIGANTRLLVFELLPERRE